MIPSELFYDLVDKNVAFDVIRKNLNGPDTVYEVGRARNQRLPLRRGDERITAAAETILQRLNHLVLSNEFMGYEPLNTGRHVMHDRGSCFDLRIEPQLGSTPVRGFQTVYDISATILHADRATQGSVLILELSSARRTEIRHMEVQEGLIADVGRISRRAIPRVLHERLAVSGCSWSARPSAEDSFAAAYGEDALEAAIAADRENEENYHSLFVEALARTRQGSVGPVR